MKLSIIVPVHNTATGGLLNHCIDSLLNQTIDDYEIITVDDASTDNSLEVLRDYEKKYSDKIKVIALPKNVRQGGAKNRGLDVCSGEYIGFIDSDDWITPDMYEKLITAAEKEGADIAICNLTKVNEYTFEPCENIKSIDDSVQGELTDEKRRGLLFRSGALVTRVFKKEIFMNPPIRFPEGILYEDNAIGDAITQRANRIAYIDEPLYFYYQHSNSTIHTISQKNCEDRLTAMKIMLERARESGFLDRFKKEYEYKFINLFYQNTLFSYMQMKGHHKLGFIRRMGKEMKEAFPDFEKNELYLKNVNKEERFLMSLQQKSTFIFVMYYKALWTYRHIRYGK